jgi:hypothetical protein
MNIEYTIDPGTGLMKLSFKQDIIGKLPLRQQHVFRTQLLKLLAFNEKLILTGSLSLKILGFEQMSAVGDYDFLLADFLTEGEYKAILKVFNLSPTQVIENGDAKDLEFSLRAFKWRLSAPDQFTVEIFNRIYNIHTGSFKIYWGDQEIKVAHPSEVWGFRLLMVLQHPTWPKTKHKHWQNSVDLFRDQAHLQTTLEKLQQLEHMKIRVACYNSFILHDPSKSSKALSFINSTDDHSPEFYDKLFQLVLDSTTLAPLPPVL